MSILIAAAGAGRCFGWQPLAKVSMMIMRPPQQRHGRGSTRGPSAAAVSNVSAGFERDGTASNSRARAMLAARLPLANNPKWRLCHGNSIENALKPRLATRHAAATASCHSAVASAKIRSVDREMRWR